MNNLKSFSYTKSIKYLFAVGGTVGILFLAWKFLSLEILLDSLSRLSAVPIIASFVAYLIVNTLRGFRFILLGANINAIDAFSMSAVHTALLRVMPLRSGELAYGVMLKRMGKGGFGHGVATILVLRLIDFSMIIIMSAITVSTYLEWSEKAQKLIITILSIGLVGFLFFASKPIVRLANRFISGQKQTEKKPLLVRAVSSVTTVLNMSLKRRILLLLSTAVLWSMVLVWFYFLMLGTGMKIGGADAFTAGMLGVVGSMLPLSLIGSFGPLEGGFALGFCAVGFDAPVAASHSVIISTITFVQGWILALPAWFWVVARSTNNSQSR